jgi:hypothetical protein
MSDQSKEADVGTMFYDGLPTRVGHLENEMSALHEDNIRTRTAISTLGSQVSTLNETMKDLAGKLDQTRTKRPDFGVLAAWAGVLLMIMASFYAPINANLNNAIVTIAELQHTHEEASYMAGRRDSQIEHLMTAEKRMYEYQRDTKD